ncbi:MAG: hypothetical protein ACRBBK_06210 [Paracoccaceae bacterium]
MRLKVLIVQSKHELGLVWQSHLARQGCEVVLAHNEDEAIRDLRVRAVDIVILDLVLEGGGAFSVADFAAYRRPEAKIIFVTNTRFFSDGSIFQHIANAAAFLPTETSLEDLSAVVEYHSPARGAAVG